MQIIGIVELGSMRPVKCRHCKALVWEMELRDHWNAEHPGELRAIDEWLGKVEDKARSWERWKQEMEHGTVGERRK